MSNSLQLYRTILGTICQMLDELRVTRQRNLARMIVGLYQSRHVYLAKIAARFPGRAKLTSKTQQMRRFVANEAIVPDACYEPYARRVIDAAASSSERLRLLIDTTHLPGERQILMVALAYRRRALPIIWDVLRRTGVTSADMQCKLLEALIPWLPDEVEVVLIGDGEFHPVDLMAWLEEQGWHYRLRLHMDTFIRSSNATWLQLRDLGMEPGDRRYLQNVYLTQDKCYGPVNLAIIWDADEDEPWFIATDQEADHYTLLDYSRRMWIDEIFGDFKGAGLSTSLTAIVNKRRLQRFPRTS